MASPMMMYFFPVRPLSLSSCISIIQDAGQLTFANRAIIIFGFHENPDIRTNPRLLRCEL